MCKAVRLTWLIVAMALAGCGNDTIENRSGRADCPHVQQGQKYAVCGGVSISGMPPEGGQSRVDGQSMREHQTWRNKSLRCGGGRSLGRSKLTLWCCVVLLGALPWAVHAATYR